MPSSSVAAVSSSSCPIRSRRRRRFSFVGSNQLDLAQPVRLFLLGVGVRRRVEQDQSLKHVGMTFGKSLCGIAAHRVSRQKAATDAELFEHGLQRVGHEVHCVDFAPNL